MAELEAAGTRLSFDDILEAVQDSKRGRWFLQEYETRIQQRDTSSILQAISRLENRMGTMAPHASSPDELAKVRSAIAHARNDILKLGLGKEGLSAEGRLFAGLAEMARKAMPVAVDSNAGIVRTLQLVDEIDQAIANPADQDKGAKFFAADANLFERTATLPKPVLVAAVETPPPSPTVETAAVVVAPPAETKKEEPPVTGAKLVIRKASQPAAEPSTSPASEPAAPVATETQPAIQEMPAEPISEMPTIDNPRIVIIRRKAEDMPEVNVGETADSVSAA